jgi:hypothetical protein
VLFPNFRLSREAERVPPNISVWYLHLAVTESANLPWHLKNPFFDNTRNVSIFQIGMKPYCLNQPNQPTMKTKFWITTLALPFFLVACEQAAKTTEEKIEAATETATEKMNAGADKVAEGVKEMKDAAKVEVKTAMDKAADKAQEVAAETKEKLDEAAETTKDAAAKALEEGAKAAGDAADKIKDATAPE